MESGRKWTQPRSVSMLDGYFDILAPEPQFDPHTHVSCSVGKSLPDTFQTSTMILNRQIHVFITSSGCRLAQEEKKPGVTSSTRREQTFPDSAETINELVSLGRSDGAAEVVEVEQWGGEGGGLGGGGAAVSVP